MTDYTYDKSGQRLFFVREATYGEPYDPEAALSAWTILAADYPHWRRFDKIPEAVDLVPPWIEKIKQYDVGDSKHASAILSGNIEPRDITIDMTVQGLEFLMLSAGNPTLSSHNQAMIQTITCPAESGNISQGDYFLIDAITSNVSEHFAVWADTVGNGTTGKPTITGINASNVLAADLSGSTPSSTATQVGAAVAAILDADATFGAANVAGVVTVTHTNMGAVQPARDGAAPMEATFAVSTWGATIYTLAEALTTALPSFTIHAEQANADSAEDIVWEYFGCVVDSIEVSSITGDKLMNYSVTFKCPYALENTNGICTNPPPKKNLQGMPAMKAFQESASNYLLQEGTTDRTPLTVDEVILKIANNIIFKGDLSKLYQTSAHSTRRDISLRIVGATQEKELFTYWQQAYTSVGGDWYPSSASARINSKYVLQRTATYDVLALSIYEWVLKEHNFHFVTVDEAVKAVEITLEDGTGDANGRSIDSFTMACYIDEAVMIV